MLTAIAWLVLRRPVHILQLAVFCDDQSKFEQANVLYIHTMQMMGVACSLCVMRYGGMCVCVHVCV